MKILTVDDSRMIRTLVGKYLRPLNLEVVEAPDGKQGLDVIRSENPDLVILDVNMPVMDGPEMLRHLREDPELKKLPVLMLTAESGQKLVLELIQMGISDYIVKPFNEVVLRKKVSKILNIESDLAGLGQGNGVGKKVLVLDENESILLVTRRFLSDIAEVYTATNPEKALQLAGQYSPQVVLLNLQTDGLQTLNILKTEDGLESTRFIAMLTTSTSDQESAALEAGFSEVLFKPFDKKTLTQMVS